MVDIELPFRCRFRRVLILVRAAMSSSDVNSLNSRFRDTSVDVKDIAGGIGARLDSWFVPISRRVKEGNLEAT